MLDPRHRSVEQAPQPSPQARASKDAPKNKEVFASRLPVGLRASGYVVAALALGGALAFLLPAADGLAGLVPSRIRAWASAPDLLLLCLLALCVISFTMAYRWIGLMELKRRMSEYAAAPTSPTRPRTGAFGALLGWLARLERDRAPEPPAERVAEASRERPAEPRREQRADDEPPQAAPLA